MSVICQNFVQNTWKKDLCSNCFKSLADHGSPYEPKMSLSSLSLHGDKNGVISPLESNTRYISQATTVYQSRSLLSHCHSTWKSLLGSTTTTTTNGSPYRLEPTTNGFHGNSLGKLSPATNEVINGKKTKDDTKPIKGASSSLQVNGRAGGPDNDLPTLNGEKENGKEESVAGILKKGCTARKGRRASVGFREEDPQIIGYGGRDYESDEAEWDISSDDGEFCLESLDVTEEDRAITKITKENTEFNSENANLLRDIDFSSVENDMESKENIGSKEAVTCTSALADDVQIKETCITSATTLDLITHSNADEDAPSCTAVGNTKNSGASSEQSCQRLTEEIKSTRFTSSQGKEHLYKDLSLWTSAECLASGAATKTALLPDTQLTSAVIKERKAADDTTQENRNSVSSSALQQSTVTKSVPSTGDKQTIPAKNLYHCASSSAVKESSVTSSANVGSVLHQNKDKVSFDTATHDVSKPRINAVKNSPPLPMLNGNVGLTNEETMPLSKYRKLDVSPTPRSSFLHGLTSKESDNSQSTNLPDNGNASGISPNSSENSSPSAARNATTQVKTSTSSALDSIFPAYSNKKSLAPSIPIESTKHDNRPPSCNYSQVNKDATSSSPDSERQSWKPKVPSKPAVPSSPPPVEKLSPSNDVGSAIKYKDDSLHYAVGRTVINNTTAHSTNTNLESTHYAESNIYQEITVNSSPNTQRSEDGSRRENKLAALALELEQARCNTSTKRQAPAPPPPSNPPEQNPRTSFTEQLSRPGSCISQSSNTTTLSSVTSDSKSQSPMKKSPVTDSNSQYSRPKSSSVSSSNPLSFKSRIPLIGDDSSKSKRGKFSLKKFLKLGKDSDSPDAPNSQGTTPNPKAWKNNAEFDRSKGKIEIIHPMDMVSKSPSSDNVCGPKGDISTQETCRDDDDFQRRRSASSSDIFTYISGSVQSSSSDKDDLYDPNGEDIYDDNLTEEFDDVGLSDENEQASNQIKNEDDGDEQRTPPVQKAANSSGLFPSPSSLVTSAASLSTPPCPPPALPPPSGSSSSGVRPLRPPKPPPPPRARAILPNGQTSSTPGSRDDQDANENPSPKGSRASEHEDHVGPHTPARPPAPKRCCSKQNLKSDYANLGDVRNPMAPKKPERSPSGAGICAGSFVIKHENEISENSTSHLDDTDDFENVYEHIIDDDTQGLEEEHIYYVPPEDILAVRPCLSANYGIYDQCQHLDHVASRNQKNLAEDSGSPRQQGYVIFQSSPREQNSCFHNSHSLSQNNDQKSGVIKRATDTGNKGDDPKEPPPGRIKQECGDTPKSPILCETLEDSYAVVVEANYEVFAAVLEQVLQEKASLLSKPDGTMLRWNDFDLDSNEPVAVLGNKVVYSAVFKYEPKLQVSLLVVPHYLPNSSNKKFLRSVLLGWFVDQLPMSFIQLGVSHYFEASQATVYVLKRCKVQTLCSYYSEKQPKFSLDATNLREISFIVLQLIHALKIAQAGGTEEVDSSPNSMVLVKAESDNISYLISDELDTPLEKRGSIYKASTPDVVKTSLCQNAVMTLLHLLHMDKLDDLMVHARNSRSNLAFSSLRTFAALAQVLSQEKASSLSQAKSLLEYFLWGPHHIMQKLPNTKPENSSHADLVLERWLDVERAQSLKSLSLILGQLKSSVAGDTVSLLTTFQEFHYLFLLRTNSRILKETALLADFNTHF